MELPSISPGKPYSFPHVDFRETIIGPMPFEPKWRNTIGVAGVFHRGPIGAVRIGTRQEFAYLYGETDDPGSIFVRQAMTQGATNFVISRVLPSPEPSKGAIAIQSNLAPGQIQAVVGPAHNRTTGLKLDLSMIAEAITLPGEYIGSEIRVPKESRLLLEDFSGSGYLDFTIAETVSSTSAQYSADSANFTVQIANTANYSDIQLILSSGTQESHLTFRTALRPGRRIKVAAGGTATFAVSAAPEDNYLEVLSMPFQYDTGIWGVHVRGRVAGVGSSGTVDVYAARVQSDYFILGYNYRSGDGALLPANVRRGLFDPVRSDGEKVDWWLTVSSSDSSNRRIFFLTFDGTNYGLLDTGIDIAFGKPGATSILLVPGSRFSIPFFAASATVGDMVSDGPNAFQPGTSAELVLSQLRAAMLSNPAVNNLLRSVTVSDLLLPVTLSFESTFEDAQANRIRYRLQRNCVRVIPAATVFRVNSQGTTFVDNNNNSLYSVTIHTDGTTYGPFPLDSQGRFALNSQIKLFNASRFEITPALTGTPTLTIAQTTNLPQTVIHQVVHQDNKTIFTMGGHADDLLYGDVFAGTDHYGRWEFMVDGQSPLQTAQLTLYDVAGNPLVLIQALSPGAYANRIRVTVRPMPPGQFRMEVYDESAEAYNALVRPEAFVLSNYTVDRNSGLYPETLDSKLIRAYFLPVVRSLGAPISPRYFDLTPQRQAPPIVGGRGLFDPSARGSLYLQNMYLSGGTDVPPGSSQYQLSERDYLRAIRELEYQDVAILALPGIPVTDQRYEGAILELIGQAERSNPTNGLRVVVLSAPRRLTPQRAQYAVMGLSSNRVVVVAGHCTYMGLSHLGTNSVPADGIYAGILAANPPHVSPAALWNGQSAFGVTSVDTRSAPPDLDIYTRSRVEVLYYDQGLRVFKFLNGVTTSSDPYERWISVRRMMDQIVMDLYANLLYVRSMPHTPSLRKRVAASVDAYLKNLVREERIYSFQPTICNESNNTMFDVSRGRLNIRITVTPVFPADFILVDVVRDLGAEMSIITQPGA